MKPLAVIAATVAMLTAAPSLHAARRAPSEAEVRQMAARYAACVVRQSTKAARAFVLADDVAAPIEPWCLNKASEGWGGQMRFPDQNYRYALAGALLARDFAQGPPPGISAAAALAHRSPEGLDEAKLQTDAQAAADVRAAFARRRSVWALDLIGECVARADPASAYALARSEVGKLEDAAMERLKPALGGCLPGQATLRLPPALVRGAIAVNLYRLAYAVRKPDHA